MTYIKIKYRKYNLVCIMKRKLNIYPSS